LHMSETHTSYKEKQMSETQREKILSLKGKLKIEAVTVAGLPEPICVKTLNGRERDAFENSCFKGKGKNRELSTENIRSKLLVRSICDCATGERLFGEHETEVLGDLPADVLDVLFTKAQILSGLAQADIEAIAGD